MSSLGWGTGGSGTCHCWATNAALWRLESHFCCRCLDQHEGMKAALVAHPSPQVASPLVFQGSNPGSSRAVQAVHVFAPLPPSPPSGTHRPGDWPQNRHSSNVGRSSSISAEGEGGHDSRPRAPVSEVKKGARETGPGSNGTCKVGHLRRWTFTWVLQQVQHGAYKGVWFTVGVRVGDYSV